MGWNERTTYRTSDVLQWWSELEHRGRHDALANEAYWLDRRRWDGPGMAVEVDQLRAWMEDYRQRRLAARLADEGVLL